VRLARAVLLGSVAALGSAAPAAGAEVQIQGAGTAWTPAEVAIAAGDTVTWSFPTPGEYHNVEAQVRSDTTSWTFATTPQLDAPSASFRFDTPGRYGYVCFVHQEMTGTVTVGDPPPPPPPPLSEQPFPNDGMLGALETGGLDRTRPKLGSVRVQRMKRGARVRFRVSERSLVTVRFKRGAKIVKTKKVNAAGTTRATVRKGLRAGRYSVELSAEDLAGNRSATRRARLTMR
jgi:plastocyanin